MPQKPNKKHKNKLKTAQSLSSTRSIENTESNSEIGEKDEHEFSMIDSHRFNVGLRGSRPPGISSTTLDENSSAHAADADFQRQRNDSQGDSSQFTLSDWQESAITSSYCESDYGERQGDFSAEQLLHYLTVRHKRTSSQAYNEISSKDEILQVKSQRIFLFCHLMGHFCRVKMLPTYDRPGATYTKKSTQQVCFDGIYVSLSFNSGEYLLEQVEEILVDSVSGKEECVNIFTDQPINIKMDNVAIIEFKGLNITFNGCENLRHKNELPKGCKAALPASETKAGELKKPEITKLKDEPEIRKEVVKEAAKPDIWANFKIPSPKNQVKPVDQKKPKDKSDKQPERRKKDRQAKPATSSPEIRPTEPVNPKKKDSTNEVRDLVRYSTEEQNEKNNQLLEDTSGSPAPFNQFKDRKTDYQFEKYTTDINKDKITKDMEVKATRLEIALKGATELQDMAEIGGNEELTHSSVVRPKNKKSKSTIPEVVTVDNTDEKELTSYTDIQRQASENSPEVNLSSEQLLKKKLFGALGPKMDTAASLSLKEMISSDSLKPADTRKQSDVRSRTSSLRNGEASRVLDHLNLEGPNIQKDEYDEYQEFLREEKKLDRRASQDFFQAEAMRLQDQLDSLEKARKQREQAQSQQQEIKPHKKFSCFNADLSTDQKMDCFKDMEARPEIKSLISFF